MSITCLVSHTANDLRCPVCGQGFLLFTGSRISATAREQMRGHVKRAVRGHHVLQTSGPDVHPPSAFLVEGANEGLAPQFRQTIMGEALAAGVC